MRALHPSKRLSITLTTLLVVVALVAGCSTPASSGPAAAGALDVVATTTVFADLVRNIGGDRVNVTSIIPAGAGPEDYEPGPDDARRLAGADLVVSNGVGLDDFLDGLIEAAGEGDVPRLVLGDDVPTLTVDGEPNPHLWLDPSLVTSQYLPKIAATLAELDPSGADAYAGRLSDYAAQVGAMDQANRDLVATIPESDRKLVTFHDAFPYFARHYGFDLVGVILDNVGQEPTASDLAGLVQEVKAAGVTAVFSESQFAPGLAEALAREAGITKVVTTLYNDTVGPAPADTYLGMMAWNVRQIVEALAR